MKKMETMETMYRCTVCGDVGTVGRCCGEETRVQISGPGLISSPDHYTAGGLEVIEILRAKLTAEEFVGFCKGNALTYIFRAGLKDSAEIDYQKAGYYLELLNKLEK